MIEIDFCVCPAGEIIGYYIKGHADYAVFGADIVCSAVSSAAYMAANTITDVLGISPSVLYVDEGVMELKVSGKDASVCRTVFQGLKLHLIHLEEQYKDYMRVSYMEV